MTALCFSQMRGKQDSWTCAIDCMWLRIPQDLSSVHKRGHICLLFLVFSQASALTYGGAMLQAAVRPGKHEELLPVAGMLIPAPVMPHFYE